MTLGKGCQSFPCQVFQQTSRVTRRSSLRIAPSTGRHLQAIVLKTVLRGAFQILCHETMNYQQLIVLLPCHSLEDFPTHHEGDDAAGLLAAWTALWHPALIAQAGRMPSWHRADAPPEDVTEKLIVVPGLSQTQLPSGFLQRADAAATCVIQAELNRERIIETALAGLGISPSPAVEAWTGDFLALGYCFLQVELLTRKLRYSSNLDEIHFQNQVVAAAAAVMEGQADEARSRLTASFDLLAMERDHYYPGEAYVLDLTMLAATTLGESLRSQLRKPTTCNLMLSGELLARLVRDEPQTLELLETALREDRAGIVGGEYRERRGLLLSCETLLTQLRQGLARCQEVLGRRPRVYGRQRFGLTPLLPQILTKLGFDAALHASFEEGVIPEGSQAKVRWEGCDGSPLIAIARSPLDAAKPQTFLSLGVKLGEAMDMDHIATVCLAHWPGTPSPWYEDLRRSSAYCSALGRFITIDEYFRTTDYPVNQDRFTYDQYRSPYLTQAVARNQFDPISRVVRDWRHRAAAEAAQSLVALAALARGTEVHLQENEAEAPIREPLDLLTQLDLADDDAETEDLEAVTAATLQRSLECLAAAMPRADAEARDGYLLANPHSFVRRLGLEIDGLAGLPTKERPVYSAAAAASTTQVVVDIPPLGFAWVAAGAAAGKAKQEAATLADEGVLQNEFFTAQIDPATGGLRSIHEYNARRNRLSLQLAFRFGEPQRSRRGDVAAEAERSYSRMVADTIETTVATQTLGEIVARGRLLDKQGQPLARYQQTYRLWRGSRVLLLDTELQPEQACAGDPWNCYYGIRFAWANEAADLYRSANLTRQPVKSKRFEAPLYVEIDDGGTRTAILTGGLPFHRRYGLRMLDSLLIVSGERCRRFQLGIGVELKNPLHEALHLITPPPVLAQKAAPPRVANFGWLFHVDARNVAATHWEALVEDGRTVGFRTRLLETQGRQSQAHLRCFRPVKTARKVNFLGETLSECAVENGAVQFPLTAHEWAEIEARW